MLKKIILIVVAVILPISAVAYDLTKLDGIDFLKKTRNDINKYTVEIVTPQNINQKSAYGQSYRSYGQIAGTSPSKTEILNEELIQAISQSNCCLVLIEKKHEPDMRLIAIIDIETDINKKTSSGDNIFSLLGEEISRKKKFYMGYRIARGIRNIRQEKTTVDITITITLKLVDSGSGAMVKSSAGKSIASITLQSRNNWLGKSSFATDGNLRPIIVAATQDALNNF